MLSFIGTCVHARFEEWFNADQQTISDVMNAENLIEGHLDDMRRLKRFQAEMRVKSVACPACTAAPNCTAASTCTTVKRAARWIGRSPATPP